MSWLKRLCSTLEKPSTVFAPGVPGGAWAATRCGLPTPDAGIPSAAAARLVRTPATAAAAAAPSEICSMNVRLETSAWTKHIVGPPRVVVGLGAPRVGNLRERQTAGLKGLTRDAAM